MLTPESRADSSSAAARSVVKQGWIDKRGARNPFSNLLWKPKWAVLVDNPPLLLLYDNRDAPQPKHAVVVDTISSIDRLDDEQHGGALSVARRLLMGPGKSGAFVVVSQRRKSFNNRPILTSTDLASLRSSEPKTGTSSTRRRSRSASRRRGSSVSASGLTAADSEFIEGTWNDRYQAILGQACANVGEEMQRDVKICELIGSFQEVVRAHVKRIVDEFHLKPVDESPETAGTYVFGDILFQFGATYSDDFWSIYTAHAKSNSEIRAVHAINGTGVRLHTALMAVVEYKGFRVVAYAIMPLDEKSSLGFGNSYEAGETFRNIFTALNLARGTEFQLPDTVEVHRGHAAGQYYALNLADIFPSDPSSAPAATHPHHAGTGSSGPSSSKSVNIRYLGAIADLTKLPFVREMATIEMVARSCKHLLRSRLRRQILQFRSTGAKRVEDELATNVASFFALVLNQEKSKRLYEYDIDHYKFTSLNRNTLFLSLQYHCGVTFEDDMDYDFDSADVAFLKNKLRGYELRVKLTDGFYQSAMADAFHRAEQNEEALTYQNIAVEAALRTLGRAHVGTAKSLLKDPQKYSEESTKAVFLRMVHVSPSSFLDDVFRRLDDGDSSAEEELGVVLSILDTSPVQDD
ncbi:hypothetical protein M427DRAFT_36322 [Gonapodya prolifera JEL478]|uniref:PH domain-containing protein n=1 Tax=Gonapodya prolifera (strain JEL478) TaxID=1344416 RepID=A0A139A3U3_GONPJ|nr:hypothetical protein M427DRAFT_36322 [Gonapodya prolifera JEL478]|eukprot:KXS11135.1 hypothetical protein M427DRAFT_36322 [Gonapodya prolifera JEL478]